MDDRVKRYSRIRYTLTIAEVVYLLFILVIFQLSGMAIWLRVWLSRFFESQFLLVFFFCLSISLIYSVLNFPLKVYRSYIVEHNFGLSIQGFSDWFKDELKESLVVFLIFIILVECFFYFLEHYPANWWLISSLFWILFSVVIAGLFPVLIIPLFFKYNRITDENLRQRIINLAGRMGIRILEVYQIDFSKKTTRCNAALTGLGRSKRVILTDTLQGKFSPEEIEVILAHEFAHFRQKHLIKLLIINSLLTFFVFYCLYKTAGSIFSRFSLDISDIAGLGIWIFSFIFFQICFTPLLNWISRNMERNADYYAIKFSNLKEAFISMMEKLNEQNLVERKPSRWIKIFFFDHPPVDERMKMAGGS